MCKHFYSLELDVFIKIEYLYPCKFLLQVALILMLKYKINILKYDFIILCYMLHN